MLIYSKLKELRTALGLTQKDVQEATGLSQRDISQIENGEKKFIPIQYIQFLNTRKISLNRLYDDNVSVEDFLKNYKSAPEIKINLNGTNNTSAKNVEPETKNDRKLIPFFDGIMEAGTAVAANMEGSYPAEMVDAGDFFQDATAIMAVHGDSMLPDYKPGSLIAMKEVRNKRLVMFGQDYVIETSEYRVIKRLQRDLNDETCWLACSINNEIWEQGPMQGRLIHEPFPVPVDEVIRMYLVLGQIHRNHSSKIIYSNLS